MLEAPALRALRGLPMRELYDLPDPRRDVLETALRRGRAYQVTLTEDQPPCGTGLIFDGETPCTAEG